MVKKRCFFHTSGFDPYDVAAVHRRFARELKQFAATWNVTAAVSSLREPGGEDGHWTVAAAGPGWKVETRYEQLDWSDIVRAELRRPVGSRFLGAAVAFADFIATGTAWRYFKANWRYGVFFLMPLLELMMFAAVAVVTGVVVIKATPAGPGIIPAVGAGSAAAATVFALLLRWPGKSWRIAQACADWTFARDYVLDRRPDVEARLAAFAERVIACARRGDADEIVIAGHSFGATFAVDVVARALARDPALGRHGPDLCLLTVGATIPKLSLHPKGDWLQEKVRRIAAEPSLTWAEYQARDDALNFHKFDPVRLRRFKLRPEPGGLTIRRVQIHDMLGAATMRRLRFKWLRLHYQFVMANERRTAYDYFMLVAGPVPFRRLVHQPNGPDDLFAVDGSLRESAALAP